MENKNKCTYTRLLLLIISLLINYEHISVKITSYLFSSFVIPLINFIVHYFHLHQNPMIQLWQNNF